jgi:hypothetical protein
MRESVTLGIVGIICLTAFLAVDRVALGQAGSIGGTVGKTDKSVSGGEEPRDDSKSSKPLRHAKAKERPEAGACDKLPGTWTWRSVGTHEVVIRSNGTAAGSLGVPARWSCTNGLAVIVWSIGAIERVTVSEDGKSLSGTGNGYRISATRE